MKSLDGEMRKIDRRHRRHRRRATPGRPRRNHRRLRDRRSRATTKNVLLECAWFDPSIIRRTARRLGLKTDASYRFERRVDPNDTLAVITEAARMIVESGGGTAEAPIDVVASRGEAENDPPSHRQAARSLGRLRSASATRSIFSAASASKPSRSTTASARHRPDVSRRHLRRDGSRSRKCSASSV